MFMPSRRGKVALPAYVVVPPSPLAAMAVPCVETTSRPTATRITFNMRISCNAATSMPYPVRWANRTTVIARTCQHSTFQCPQDEPRLGNPPDLQPKGDYPGRDRERAAADLRRLGVDRGGRRLHRRHGRPGRRVRPASRPDPAEEPGRERGAQRR